MIFNGDFWVCSLPNFYAQQRGYLDEAIVHFKHKMSYIITI